MHSVTLIPRHLTEKLTSTLRTTRVINIVGPRQTGKTTLVRDLVEAARFLDLDDESLFASLALDPYGQLSTLSSETGQTGLPIVIDEVQRLPQITLALKRIVDRDRRAGQFVLTGGGAINVHRCAPTAVPSTFPKQRTERPTHWQLPAISGNP